METALFIGFQTSTFRGLMFGSNFTSYYIDHHDVSLRERKDENERERENATLFYPLNIPPTFMAFYLFNL